MPAPKAIWAIDIGQCALKALHAKVVGEEIEIDNYAVIPHEKILSQPDVDEPALIRKTLATFASKFEVGKDTLIISVPGHRSFARFSKLPPVEPKKIPDIVHYEATQQIPFGIDEVVWDYHVFQGDDSPDVEVGIFAIKRSIIAQYLEYFSELDLHPAAIQTAPVAMYNACEYEGLIGDKATILADVGAQNTNFIIAEDSRLWLRNIPLGGNNFTEALQKAFKLNFAKAEELKCSAATSKYARAVFQAMRPIFSDLSSEIQRSIGFYTSINREAEMNEACALGNAFRLPGLLKFLQQNLGLPVKKLETFSKVKLADTVDEADFGENALTLVVAYGMILQGAGVTKVNTDLMPPEIIREATWSKKAYWFAAAAACLLLAAGAVWMRGASDSGSFEADRSKNESSITRIVKQYSDYKNDYRRSAESEETEDPLVEDFSQISKNRILLPEIMKVINQSLPKPQEALANVSTPEEYKAAAEKIQRDQRTQIFVSDLVLTYVPDLTDAAVAQIENASKQRSTLKIKKSTSPAGGMGGPGMMGPGMMGPGMMGPGMMGPGMAGPGMMGPGMGAPGMGEKKTKKSKKDKKGKKGRGRQEPVGKRAFVVTLNGTTPHVVAPVFLTTSVMKELAKYDEKWARTSKQGFWIDHVKLLNCQQPLMTAKEREKLDDEDVPTDPITGESILDDASFAIAFVVNIGTPPDEEIAQDDGSKKGKKGKKKKKKSKKRG